MVSGRVEMKEKAIDLIIKARKLERKKKSKKVRKFVLPRPHDVDLDAENFLDMMRWDTLENKIFTPPPILSDYSDEELVNVTKENLPQYLCHSQVKGFS